MMFLFGTIIVVLERVVSIWPKRSFPLVLRFAAIAVIGFGLLLLLAVPGELTGVLPGFATYTALGTSLFVVIIGAWFSDHSITLYSKTREKPYSRLGLGIVFGLIIVGFDASLASAVLLLFDLLPTTFVAPLVAIPFAILLAGGAGSYLVIKTAGARMPLPPKA